MPRGFRAFGVSASDREAFLTPANGIRRTDVPLEFPMTRAICAKGADHLAPGRDCTCGYYAYNDLGGACQWMRDGQAWVMAEVWGHGHVQLHDYGWRAEKLQIIRFFAPICDTRDCDETATTCWDPTPEWKDTALWFGRFSCPAHDSIRRTQPTLGDLVSRSVPVEEIMCWLAAKFGAEIVDADATRAAYSENRLWRAEIERQERAAMEKIREQQHLRWAVRRAKSNAKWEKSQATVELPGI